MHLLRRLRHPTPLLGLQEPLASVHPGDLLHLQKKPLLVTEEEFGGVKPGKKMRGPLLEGEGTVGMETVAVTQSSLSHSRTPRMCFN